MGKNAETALAGNGKKFRPPSWFSLLYKAGGMA